MVVAADTAGNWHPPRNDLRVFEGDRGSTATSARPAVTTKTGQSGGGGDHRSGASKTAGTPTAGLHTGYLYHLGITNSIIPDPALRRKRQGEFRSQFGPDYHSDLDLNRSGSIRLRRN
jgi:hypothetical protein